MYSRVPSKAPLVMMKLLPPIFLVMSMSMLTLVAAGRAGFYFLQAQQAIRYLAMHSKVS